MRSFDEAACPTCLADAIIEEKDGTHGVICVSGWPARREQVPVHGLDGLKGQRWWCSRTPWYLAASTPAVEREAARGGAQEG